MSEKLKKTTVHFFPTCVDVQSIHYQHHKWWYYVVMGTLLSITFYISLSCDIDMIGTPTLKTDQ